MSDPMGDYHILDVPCLRVRIQMQGYELTPHDRQTVQLRAVEILQAMGHEDVHRAKQLIPLCDMEWMHVAMALFDIMGQLIRGYNKPVDTICDDWRMPILSQKDKSE